MEVSLELLDGLLSAPEERNLSIAWNLRKIAVAFENPHVETLAALAYEYTHQTQTLAFTHKTKMAKGLGQSGVQALPAEILDRVAANGISWLDIAKVVIPDLNTSLPIQGKSIS